MLEEYESHRMAQPQTAIQLYSQKVELNKSQNKKCMLCGHKEISQQLNSPLYMLNDVIVHYFCIMLSTKAVKNGSDKEGIWGYLLNDIRAEITRGSRVTCVYCNKKGATLSCIEAVNCRKQFHLPCGLKNGSMHHFFQPYKSFCQQHRVQPVIDLTEILPSAYPTVECGICNDNVVPSTSPTAIWVPCCSVWFHRVCVQDLALRRGYFIECPKCENVDKFKSRILLLGINIPSLYATWEKRRSSQNAILNTLQNSFEKFSERSIQCDATRCLCPHEGKRNFQNEFRWKLVLCRTCGYRQTHVSCSSIRFDEKWNCEECQTMITNIPARRLELPIDGNAVGISAIFGDFDAYGMVIRKKPYAYIPGYIQRRE
ncbi:PHD finger protein 7 [Acyrthosiphon pisum]|uniref:G2/M phase-specific E3 ubiquitin-protein ligase n=1 Tax=Acyrthosiphon pisum TaxID=7029 RepID=A0A8R2JLI1_ACYPI|nr:PHD finger protein 7 [Acyrthosiphon pisum]